MQSGELRDGELFRARIEAQALRSEGFADGVRLCQRSQVVDERFALLSETQFHKIQKGFLAAKRQVCPFAWKTKRYQCGTNFWRRAEGAAWNAKDQFGTTVKLRGDREITVLLRLRLGGEPESDFFLNHDVNFIDPISERKKMMKNRRSDVIRQIAVDAGALSSSESSEIGFKNISLDNRDVRKLFREPLEPSEKQPIQLDGIDRCAGGRKVLRHFTVTGANFDPAVRWAQRGRTNRSRVRRNADGPRDLFAPAGVREKVLAKALTSHAPKV